MPDESIWDEMTPEERVQAVVEDPSLLQEPPAEVVQEIDPTEELPPEPTFKIVRNAYGPGAHSVKFADGKAVGVWVEDQQMTPEEVEEQLTSMGLDDDLVAFFVRNRAGAIAALDTLAADPVVAAFATEEERRGVEKAATREAFLAAYRKKAKEKP